ncbi:MAG: hypothetical protein JSS51_08295 [Planctomycetes bacterium]|nr:hypothetical protein [Planctomycetota bacterium]
MHPITRLLIALVLCLAGTGCQTTPASSTPSTPARNPAPPAWYEPEIRAFESADKVHAPASGSVLFIGSSSIRMWKTLEADMSPVPVLNRGFGGSQTRDVNAVFDRIVLPYKPSIIVYYCGDNDLGTDNTDSRAAADGFIAFAERAHRTLPRVRIFYVAIKPSLARWKNWPAMEAANAIVRAYCEKTPDTAYLDVATPMLTEQKTPDPTLFLGDGLHMNAKGYAIWTAVVRPPVEQAWRDAAQSH